MKRKGIDFRRAPHLYFRSVRPEDMERCVRDRQWRDHDGAYVVIIRKRDCIDDDGNWSHELKEKATCLPFDGWSRTNMVYGGVYRKQTCGAWFWIPMYELSEERQTEIRANENDHDIRWYDADKSGGQVRIWRDVYWTSTTYWVENGSVYTSTSHLWRDPTSKAA
jgi:hypothetical protein